MPNLADTPRSGGSPDEPTGPYEMARLIRGLRYDLVQFRELLAHAPASVPPPPSSPTPPAHKLTVGTAAKWFFLANGALEFAVQVAAMFKPDLVGPLQALREMLRGAL